MTQNVCVGRAAWIALPGLAFILLCGGCGSKTADTADGGTVSRPAATTVPANAPPAAQGAISASEAQGSEMQRRANANAAAMKAAAGNR